MKSSDGAVDPTLTPSQALPDAASSDTVAADGTGAQHHAHGHLPPLCAAGYEIGELIGRGGMGEVLIAHDAKIGRKVAIKRMRSTDATGDAVERFLREAKIQARLDHPAIVPVHELGEDADGRPFFTMKRLAGRTLQDVLAEASPQRLLRAYVDVCLAIEFAHARGVVHRDLKPSNIMLGDYGEVYVLDWGIARVIGDREGGAGESGDITTLEGHTQVGAMLGTPGYMAPEQVRGDAEIGTAADVYALGCILFEILVGEALHPKTNAAIASTLAGSPDGPCARRPDRGIAPELDEACMSALAAEPERRPTARELADRVQRYLDGDRDVERRRTLAAELVVKAREAAADPDRRAEAMRIAGRALALDHESNDAATLVTALMIEPPKQLPKQLEQQLDDFDAELGSRSARVAMFAILAYFMFVPIALWAGVLSWPLFFAIYGVIAFAAAQAGYMWKTRRPSSVLAMLVNAVMMILFSRVVGWFIFVPGIIAMYTATLVAQPDLIDRPWLVIGCGLVTLVTPVVLEATGVFHASWSMADGRLAVTSTTIHLGGIPIWLLLIIGNAAMIVIGGLFGRAISVSRRDAQRQLEIQAWHLRQLLPVEAPRPALPPAACVLR